MSISKNKLAGSLKKKNLSLEEKVKILNYAEANPSEGCRKIGEKYGIGKTMASDIKKNSKKLRKDYETFKGSYKKHREGKYHDINNALYNWYNKCVASNIFPDGALLQEEAMFIKEALQKEELIDFTASNGWLQKWKAMYSIREKRTGGEGNDVPAMTVEAWIERLPELNS